MEIPEQNELLPLLSIYVYQLAIGYFGVVKGVGMSSTHSLDSSLRSHLNLVGQLLGTDCCPYSSWGLHRCPGYVKKLKLVWHWVILNSQFRFCIWHTWGLPSVIYDTSKS